MADYASGVTIKVNDVAVEISAATRQADHAVVHYTIPAVSEGDTVTWEYSAAVGAIVAETGGEPLEDVSAQSVTNNVIGDDYMQTTVILHHDDILALPTTRFEVVPAPGEGKTIIPLSGFVVADFPSSGYVAESTIELAVRYGGIAGAILSHYIGGIDWLAPTAASIAAPIAFPRIAEGTGDYSGNFFVADAALSAFENRPLVLYDDDNDGGSNYTGGDAANTLTVTVIYTVIDV